MGSIDRKERLKKQIRFNIIEAAKNIAMADGWASVSIRKIAGQIDYSAPIVYEHFRSKDDLLEEIRKDGFGTLSSIFLQVKSHFSNPEKQLMEVSKEIWKFACKNLEVFQLMFNIEGAYCTSKKVFAEAMNIQGNPIWEMLANLKPRPAVSVTKTYYEWWCVAFGFITITMTTQPKHAFGQAESLYIDAIRRFINSIR
jgi:AcrR family transcriptional regulator